MEALYFAIPISIALAIVSVVLFLWAIKDKQMSDLDTPPIRILFEDEELPALLRQKKSDQKHQDSNQDQNNKESLKA